MHVLPQAVGKIHFIGIGGIGMSGIAEILQSLGYQVQGSDQKENANVVRLREKGISIWIGHENHHVEGASVVVISSAVRFDNRELAAARKLGLPIVKRADMLAEIMRLKPSVAVGGTHGKTTTTSMLATLMGAAGLDPTVVSGGIINSFGTNARLGTGDWVVAEADESDGSFTRLPATISIVTNIDPEHLEHYGSFEALQKSFRDFVENIPFYGLGVICIDHPTVRELYASLTDRRVVRYGFSEDADIKAFDLKTTPEGTSFKVQLSDHLKVICKMAPSASVLEGFFLPVLGEHNVLNALAVIATAIELGMSLQEMCAGLAAFRGVQRRFTHVGDFKGARVIDDYAHHPTEIEAVLKTARQAGQGRVIAVVQPHRYSRLKNLFAGFVEALKKADHVVITPVYAAGEEPLVGFDHTYLAQNLRQQGQDVTCVASLGELADFLSTHVEKNDCLLFMGAGDITQWVRDLPTFLDQKGASYGMPGLSKVL